MSIDIAARPAPRKTRARHRYQVTVEMKVEVDPTENKLDRQLIEVLEYSYKLRNFWDEARQKYADAPERLKAIDATIKAEAEREIFALADAFRKAAPSVSQALSLRRLLNGVDFDKAHFSSLLAILLVTRSNEPGLQQSRKDFLRSLQECDALTREEKEYVLGYE